MAPALALPLLATNAAFFVVFGIFVVAMIVLIVIIIMWAVRNDVAGRRAWRARQQAAIEAGAADQSGPYAIPQNRLQVRANERAQRARQRQQPQPPS